MAVRIADRLRPLLVPMDQIKPDPDNPNNGDVEAVIESITVNGYMLPIVVREDTGVIEAGHTRYNAMLALGETHIPVVYSGHDREGARRFLIGDNQTGRLAVMDNAALAALLTDLQENTELGLLGSGFDQDSMERLLLDVSTPTPVDSHGYGGPQPLGIFQVVIEFDTEEDMEAAAADLADVYDNLREVRL